DIQQRTFKLWSVSFLGCLVAAGVIGYIFPSYNIVIYLFLLLIPLGYVRSMSMSYSIILDYTKYYLVRTYSIALILLLNISLARFVLELPNGLYYFSLYIGLLISLLIIVYRVTFKKYNIYEMYHS